MKRLFLFLICVIGVFSINTAIASAKEPDKTPRTLYINNYDHSFDNGYVIDGEDYYRINDIFFANYGRPEAEQISVRFNEQENCIEAYYTKYSSVPTENIMVATPTVQVFEVKENSQWGVSTYWSIRDLETGEIEAHVTKDPFVYMRDKIFSPRKETVKVKTVDGEYKTITRYAIYKSYYYKITDLTDLIKCSLDYSEDKNAYFVISSPESRSIQYSKDKDRYFVVYNSDSIYKIVPDVSDVPDRVAYTGDNWAPTALQYMYDNGNDTFSTFGREQQSGEGGVFYTARTFRKSDFACIDTKKIYAELDYYCGFFSGEHYNYIGYGANNREEIPDQEILRIVKYDKDFNRISSVSLTTEQCYAIKIGYAGTMVMAERGNELAVHTTRLRRKTEDGLNHQSQLSLVIDTDTMTVKNDTSAFQPNHVSHSFYQGVRYDGNEIVYVDLGDGYPRALVLNTSYGKTVNLYNIPGKIGDNYTGVNMGGFEISPDNYFVTFNTVDFAQDSSGCNACLAIYNKSAQTIKIVNLSDCFGKEMYASAPFIVKINDNRFVILWAENNNGFTQSNTKYVEIDGAGNFLGEIRTSNKPLPDFLQPMYMDNALYWYKDYYVEVSIGVGRRFYKLDLDPFKENPIRVLYNDEEIKFDQNPIIENGRTLVPLRAIFEKLGADVEWDEDTQTVIATKNDTKISLTIDNTAASKNGESITLDVPAKVVNGRTLVPVRFVADCFGVDVGWDGTMQRVSLTSK